LKKRAFFAVAAVAVLSGMAGHRALAQDSDYLSPQQSEAKARAILDQAIAAYGGPAYLNLHDSTCTFHYGSFEHSGAVGGYGKYVQYSEPPTKERTENLPQRNEIDVYSGDKGWNMDRGGVSEEPESQLSKFQNDTATDIDNILRHRIHEPDIVIRYDGNDIVDLKQADWVQLVDSSDRTFRIAFDRATHLPLRRILNTRDPKYRTTAEEIEIYSNFHVLGGIETPLQISRERNGQAVYQVFFDDCSYNTGLDESIFTRQSLDDRFAKIGKKPKESKKDKKSDSDSDSSSSH
jgi:hypothetical protein